MTTSQMYRLLMERAIRTGEIAGRIDQGMEPMHAASLVENITDGLRQIGIQLRAQAQVPADEAVD